MGILKRFENNEWVPVVVGAQGATGATGPVGATGPQGDTGPVGATGPGVNFDQLDNTALLFNFNGDVESSNKLVFDPTTDTLNVSQVLINEVTGISNLIPDEEVRTDENYAFLTNQDPAAPADVGSLRRYRERLGFADIDDGRLIVDRFGGQVNDFFLGDGEEIIDIEFPGVQLVTYVGGDPEDSDSYRFDTETVTIIVYGPDEGTATIDLPTFTDEGGILLFSNGVNSVTLDSFFPVMISITLIPDFEVPYIGLVTISPQFTADFGDDE
jgi:hypothetical protein